MSFKVYIFDKFSRLMQASNFQKAFRPIYALNIAFGGVYIFYREDGSINYQATLTTFAWFVIITLFYGKFMLEMILVKYYDLKNVYYKVQDCTWFLLNVNVSICVVVTIVENIIYAFTNQYKLVLKIENMEHLLQNADVSIDWTRVRSYCLKMTLSLCLFLTVHILILCLGDHLIFCYVQTFNYLGQTVIVYNSFIYMTTLAFLKLNIKLATLKDESERQNTHAPSLVAEIALAHLALCELVREYNAAFGLQLLVVVLNSFAFIIEECFLFFTTSDETPISSIILRCSSAIAFIIFTVLLVETCKDNSNEAFESLPIAIDIMNEELMDDEELADMLLQFMEQISKPQHTAFGFFKLDRALYFNILMSASTLIIVLLHTNDVREAYIQARLLQNESNNNTV